MTSHLLAGEQIEAYQRDGHIRLRGLLPKEEVGLYRDEIRLLVDRLNTERRRLQDRDTYGKAFLQIFNLWRESELIRRFVLSQHFAKIAAQLMGVERVRIYHDQALFKEAGGGHTPWHQDQFYWPLDTDKTITLWMPMINLTPDMGIMAFASGSHTSGSLLEQEISDSSEDYFQTYIRENGFIISTYDSMTAGDATFHSGWTLHHAPANTSSVTREVMTIIYYADGTRILVPDNAFRKNDLQKWLGGRQPGELADSDLNPLI